MRSDAYLSADTVALHVNKFPFFFSSFAANFLVVSDDIIITVAIIVCCCCKTAHAHQFLSKCMLPALIMSRIAYACVCYTCSLSGCADMLLSMSIFAQYNTVHQQQATSHTNTMAERLSNRTLDVSSFSSSIAKKKTLKPFFACLRRSAIVCWVFDLAKLYCVQQTRQEDIDTNLTVCRCSLC